MTKVSFIDSAFYAIKGLFRGVSKERNIRIQFLITFVLILIGILSGISKLYLIIILTVCFFGITLELFNTGFEKFIDLIYPEYNKDVGKFKDEMAGIVLLTFGMAVIISCIIIYEPALNLFTKLSANPIFIWMIIADICILFISILILYVKNKN